MKSKLYNLKQVSWMLDHASQEKDQRVQTYGSLVRRGRMTKAKADKHQAAWALVYRLLQQLEKDIYQANPDRPIVLKATEIQAALTEARREQYLRKKRYDDRDTKEATRKLKGIENIVKAIEEQKKFKTGVQTSLF